MLKPKFAAQFKKAYKIAIKRGCTKEKLRTVIERLCLKLELPSKYLYHALNNSKKLQKYESTIIEPDWLLIHQVEDSEWILKLVRTGSHSDLFHKIWGVNLSFV